MQDKKFHPDQKFIDALLTNNHILITEIYKRFSRKVISFIQKNSGNIEEAKDIIQETLIVIYQQARDKNFVLTCPFDAYFFLLCKRKWLNKLKLKTGVTIGIEFTSITDEAVEGVFETEMFEFKSRLFESKFQELGTKCQELLKLCFKSTSLEDVAAKLEVTYGYVRKKKSLCLGQLTELIQNSDEYKFFKKH